MYVKTCDNNEGSSSQSTRTENVVRVNAVCILFPTHAHIRSRHKYRINIRLRIAGNAAKKKINTRSPQNMTKIFLLDNSNIFVFLIRLIYTLQSWNIIRLHTSCLVGFLNKRIEYIYAKLCRVLVGFILKQLHLLHTFPYFFNNIRFFFLVV